MAVRRREWQTPTGETKFAYQVDYYDAGGVRRRETFPTKKLADAHHAQVAVGIANGTHTAKAASVTVAVAAQQWLDECDRLGFERATVVGYAQHVRLHIVPRLGAVRLSDLTVAAVADWKDALRADGVSEVLVRKVRTSLGAILTLAQQNGRVAQNVVRAQGRVKRNKRAEATAQRAEVGVDIPLPAEIRALLPQLQGRFRALLLTAVFTGLRWSELRGLTWAALDLDGGELTVSQRIDRYGNVGAPKTAAGNRTIPLLPLVVNALREHAKTSETDLVFANSQGNAEHRNTVIEAYQAAQVAAGVVDGEGAAKYPGLHALRHFFASWCINRKADGGRELPLKVVQGLLGHGSIKITADVYGHLFPRTDDRAELVAAETAFLAA